MGCGSVSPAIADPRDRRGVRHSLAAILGLCTAAVTSGQVLLADITAWITAADQEVLAAFGCRRDAEGRYTPPHPDTVERVFALLGGPTPGRWGRGLAGRPRRGRPGRRADRRAGRGCRRSRSTARRCAARSIGADATGRCPTCWPRPPTSESVVLAERLIGAKTNEVPEFAPLLRGLAQRVGGLGGCVFTMDAAHTVRAHARLITSELLAHYVMIVKQNTPTLYDKIDALDWANAPIAHETLDIGHGRRDKRTIRVRDAPADLGFPGCGAGVPGRAVHHPHRPQTPERLPPLQEGADPQRGGRPRRDQPVGPRGRPRAPGRLRPPALVDRKQDPLGA